LFDQSTFNPLIDGPPPYADSPLSLQFCASVTGDPSFVGLLGQKYQVHGMDGAVYNLISDIHLQVNSRFVFLSSGRCPIIDGLPAANCYSHPGSYLGSICI